MLHAVVMAGGSGTRFWPARRTLWPKQLLPLLGERSMIQATVDRLAGAVPPERIMVVTNQQLVAPIVEQLPTLPKQAVIGEPCKRDTAPCIGLAAAMILRDDPEGTMIVLPSDHAITPESVFRDSLLHAATLVDERPEGIVTFGIRPTYPATCYGYIECGAPIAAQATDNRFRSLLATQFREKPDLATAGDYVLRGNFLWNAGIFVWKAKTIDACLARFEPEMHERLQAIAKTLGTTGLQETLEREFTAIKGKSIDYAVLERSKEIVVVEAEFSWDDVGNWQSLARQRGQDGDDNTVVGRHIGVETTGSIVFTNDQHLVVTLGMKDCIVVHTKDATLVANKNDEEAMRKVTKLIQEQGWHEFL